MVEMTAALTAPFLMEVLGGSFDAPVIAVCTPTLSANPCGHARTASLLERLGGAFHR
jgi:hypothetical protein